jgi:hypothetical protein
MPEDILKEKAIIPLIEELKSRKFYKQIIRDYVHLVRSIIPGQVIDDHIKLCCVGSNKFKDV